MVIDFLDFNRSHGFLCIISLIYTIREKNLLLGHIRVLWLSDGYRHFTFIFFDLCRKAVNFLIEKHFVEGLARLEHPVALVWRYRLFDGGWSLASLTTFCLCRSDPFGMKTAFSRAHVTITQRLMALISLLE